jgi:hypothetical protein
VAANITHCSAVAATKVADYNLQCHAAADVECWVGQLLLPSRTLRVTDKRQPDRIVQKCLRCPETDGLIQDLKSTPNSSQTEA